MSSHYLPPAVVRRLAFAAAILLCVAHSTSGQWVDVNPPPRLDNPATRARGSSGRRTDNRARTAPGKPSPRVSAAEDKQEKIERAIAEGNGARDRNEYKQALAHYREVSETLAPKDPRAFYGMGNVYSDLHCHDSAVASYRKALDLKEDYVEALVGMGYAYFAKERYDDAEGHFRAALKFRGNDVEANLGLGLVYAKRGEFREASDRINLVINDKDVGGKERAKAQLALGDVYWLRGTATQWEWPEIIEQYQKAVKDDPGLARAYVSLGAALMTQAFDKFASVALSKITVQDREQLAAAAKEANGYIEEAINEHGYSRPDADLLLSLGLTHQARYQDAASKAKSYIDKVNALKERMSSPEMNVAVKCDYGFGRLLTSGYWHWGFARLEESTHETDGARKAALLDEAGSHFKQAIELKEDSAVAYSQLGLVYSQQGKYAEAIEQYNYALIHTKDESGKKQLHNSIKVAYIRRARDKEGRGKYEDAVEDYKKAVPHAVDEPDKAALYQKIGEVYNTLGRFDDALNNVQEAIRRDPKNPSFYESLASIYVMQGDLENTFKWLKKADEVRTTPSTNPDPYYYLGATYTIRFLRQGNEGDFNEAVRWLKKAIEINHDYPPAYHALGTVYQSHSNPDEALDSYEKAVRYDPKNPTAYMTLGQGYFELKHNDEAAIQYLKRAIELKPDYVEAHWRLGLAHLHKKDYTEAAKAILEAFKYDPKDLQAHLALASVYKDQKNYAEAIRYLKQATGVAPKDFRPYKELAKIYEEQKKNDDAIQSYEEAVKLLSANDQRYSWIRNVYLGRIERLRGHYAEAIAYFQKLPQPPTELPGQTLYDIGLTYVAAQNKKAALEQYQQLLRMKSPLADELRNTINEMK